MVNYYKKYLKYKKKYLRLKNNLIGGSTSKRGRKDLKSERGINTQEARESRKNSSAAVQKSKREEELLKRRSNQENDINEFSMQINLGCENDKEYEEMEGILYEQEEQKISRKREREYGDGDEEESATIQKISRKREREDGNEDGGRGQRRRYEQEI